MIPSSLNYNFLYTLYGQTRLYYSAHLRARVITLRNLPLTQYNKGLYCYTCMPFRISSAPAIFERIMDIVLQGIPMLLATS